MSVICCLMKGRGLCYVADRLDAHSCRPSGGLHISATYLNEWRAGCGGLMHLIPLPAAQTVRQESSGNRVRGLERKGEGLFVFTELPNPGLRTM
jgi:hypothetical protein